MRYLPTIKPAGLLVLEPADQQAIREFLEELPELTLLCLAELAQLLRAAAIGAAGDPLQLLSLVSPGAWSRVLGEDPYAVIRQLDLRDPADRPDGRRDRFGEYLARRFSGG